MARLVRCPRCHKLLVEYPNIPVYQCGGCSIVLRAKNQNIAAAAEENSAPGSPQLNKPESQTDTGFSDSGSISSARETTASLSTIENEGEKNTLPNTIAPPSTNTADDHQGRTSDTNLETEDQRVENSMNESKAVAQPSQTASHIIALEEDMIEQTHIERRKDALKSPMSPQAYDGDGSISYSDDGYSTVTPYTQMPRSRRTFIAEDKLKSRSVASSSSPHRRTMFNDVGAGGLSLDSQEFQSVENWMAEPNEGDLSDKMELLRKLDEMRDHLVKICVSGEERGPYPQRSSQQKHKFPVRHFPEQGTCSCLQCQEQRRLHLHGHGSRRAKSQDLDSHSSSSGSQQRSHFNSTQKHHCRPISGAAPFVICGYCNKLLQLPVDFLVSRRRMHKLQCGGCGEVLDLAFPTKDGNYTSVADHAQEKAYVSVPEHGPHPSSAARGVNHGDRLHWLMGYNSASDLLYEQGGIPEAAHGRSGPMASYSDGHARASSSLRDERSSSARAGVPRPGTMKESTEN